MNRIIKRIIDSFISYFKPKKYISINPTKEVETSDKLEIDFKDEFSVVNDLSDINAGDIIFAKRYNNLEEKELIPEGHRIGPSIVLKNDGSKLIVLGGSSKIPEKNNYFYIKCGNFHLNKDTYFNLKNIRIMPNFAFLEKKSEMDFDVYDKLIYALKKKYGNKYYNSEKPINLSFLLKPGDIIKKENKYYIILNIVDDKLYCVLKKSKKVDLSNINFNKIKCFDFCDEFEFVEKVSNTLLMAILKRQREYLDRVNNISVAQRGSLIKFNDKLYYIYGEQGNDWLCFEVLESIVPRYSKISINKRNYYSDYRNDLKVCKNANYDCIDLAHNEEIEKIKITRKDYIKSSNLEEEYSKDFSLITVGSIVKNKITKKGDFIVIAVTNDMYECMLIDDIRCAKYKTYWFNKKDVRLSDVQEIDCIEYFRVNNADLSVFADPNILTEIFDMQKLYLEKLKSIEIVKGSIIDLNDKYYYIYGENEKGWVGFSISLEEYENGDILEINDQVFFADYNDIRYFYKHVRYKIVDRLSEDNVNYIKEKRKTYKKSSKKV